MPHDHPKQKTFPTFQLETHPKRQPHPKPHEIKTMLAFTETERAALVPTLTKMMTLANRPLPYTQQEYGDWKQIIAQLLEQLGPFLIQMLISFLLGDRTTADKE